MSGWLSFCTARRWMVPYGTMSYPIDTTARLDNWRFYFGNDILNHMAHKNVQKAQC